MARQLPRGSRQRPSPYPWTHGRGHRGANGSRHHGADATEGWILTSELADLALDRMDGLVVVTVAGEIDMSNAVRVRERIAGFVTPDDWAVVLDLSELTFIDSVGLHGVSVLAELLEERRQGLFLCVPPSGNIARTVELVGLYSVSIHADQDLAIAAARADQPTSRPYPSEGA